jgi:hypothetical protein
METMINRPALKAAYTGNTMPQLAPDNPIRRSHLSLCRDPTN